MSRSVGPAGASMGEPATPRQLTTTPVTAIIEQPYYQAADKTTKDPLDEIRFECTDCGELVWQAGQAYHYCMGQPEEDNDE